MNKFEKRLCVFIIVFVAIYIGAVVLTIHSRVREVEKITRIEALETGPGEGQVMLAELLFPMSIFFYANGLFYHCQKEKIQSDSFVRRVG